MKQKCNRIVAHICYNSQVKLNYRKKNLNIVKEKGDLFFNFLSEFIKKSLYNIFFFLWL